MTPNGLIQIALYVVVLLLLVRPLGSYMARVYQGQRIWLDGVLGPIERLIYRLCGVTYAPAPTPGVSGGAPGGSGSDAGSDSGGPGGGEMGWKLYAGAALLFKLACVLAVYGLLRLQAHLPLNPQGQSAVAPYLSLNTAVSFATNTNWQNYGGENTLSYVSQMLGLAVQNFLSAAWGMALLAALIRGIVRHNASTIGNFWVDLTRTTLYILLPLSLVLAVALVSQGVIQNFKPYQSVDLVQATTYDNPKVDAQGNPVKDDKGNPVTEKATVAQQLMPMGPVASQLAIKHLGTNGGGFFNANAAHPFENPTPLSDFLLILAQTLIPASLCYTFGKMVRDTRQGWAILAAMMILLVIAILVAYGAEAAGNPRLTPLGPGVDQTASNVNPGGNMEGKELRFGVARSAMFEATTTATSCGAVNSMHDSFMPLGGLVALAQMQLSETVLGGVGSGLYGMLMFAIVAVFIAGLMVGRTPEYLGKKIEAYEMKMASLVLLFMPLIVLFFTALACIVAAGHSSDVLATNSSGPHAFSEILYAYTSQANNNGSAFAGLSGNTPFYNLTGALAMMFGRFWLAIPALAIAGSLARKKLVPAGAGTLNTHTPLFVVLLISVVLIVGALTFFPALALGPIVEHLMLMGH